jgi:hypothetical protein
MKAGTPATTRLFVTDDPAEARETSLEIVFKAEEGSGPPATSLNGQPLHELKSTRSKSELTLFLSSAGMKAALKRGINDFTFIPASSATLTSLSVRVVPETR